MSGQIHNESTPSFAMLALDKLLISKIAGASVSSYGCIKLAIHSVGAVYQKVTQGDYDDTGIKQSFEVIKEGGKIAFPVFRQQFDSTEEFLDAAAYEPYLGTLIGIYRLTSGIYNYFPGGQ